jgi:hypothetical protein
MKSFFMVEETKLEVPTNCIFCHKALSVGDISKVFGATTETVLFKSESPEANFYTFCSEGCRSRWILAIASMYPTLEEFANSFVKKEDENVSGEF